MLISPKQVQARAGRGVEPLRRAAGAAPLAHDVPEETMRNDIAELVQRKEARGQKKNASDNTTDKQYQSAYKKWYHAFCEYAGWKAEETLAWLDSETGECNANGWLYQFFKYMHSTEGMTKGPFKTAIFWAERELNKQRTLRNLPPYSEYLVSLPGIRCLRDEIYSGARTQKLEHMVDLQVCTPDSELNQHYRMTPIV